jgi:hypothetical protein
MGFERRRSILVLVCCLWGTVLPLCGKEVLGATIQLARTGQTGCYDEVGQAITCAGTGQDGAIRAGVAWPVSRFADNGNGTVTDKLTGLMWTQDALMPTVGSCAGASYGKEWQEALDYVKCLNGAHHLGYNDWRLPNINELDSMINPETHTKTWLQASGFTIDADENSMAVYWTSTTYAFNPEVAWFVSFDLFEDVTIGLFKTYSSGRAWPVRGSATGPAKLWQTGQTKCYDSQGKVVSCAGTGQDGEIRAGVAWPNPRFTVVDACVTDNLTGLMWPKNPGGTRRTWQEALTYANRLNLCGFSNWRLPNMREMRSLVNYAQPDNAAWLKSKGFGNVKSYMHWSSTNGTWLDRMMANTFDPWSGGVFNFPMMKSYGFYAWPVR